MVARNDDKDDIMLNIDKKYIDLAICVEEELKDEYKLIDNACFQNSIKVLNAFHKYNINENHFNSTTGYGYGDIGRDTIEKVFADILGAEDALVRNQFISGSHALNVAFLPYLDQMIYY